MMAMPCTICQHPQRTVIDVSLLRDGTRPTARQYGLSRSALDRHRRHVLRAVPNEDCEAGAGNNEMQALLFKVDAMIRDCEQALAQAKTDRDSSALVKLMRELRANVAFKHRLLQWQERANGTEIGPGGTSAPGREQSPSGNLYDRIQILSLRIITDSMSSELGDRSPVPEPATLECLQERHAELGRRLECKELLRLSKGLGKAVVSAPQ